MPARLQDAVGELRPQVHHWVAQGRLQQVAEVRDGLVRHDGDLVELDQEICSSPPSLLLHHDPPNTVCLNPIVQSTNLVFTFFMTSIAFKVHINDDWKMGTPPFLF